MRRRNTLLTIILSLCMMLTTMAPAFADTHEYIIKLENKPVTTHVDLGESAYYSLYYDDFSIVDAVTGKAPSEETRREIAYNLYYEWVNDKDVVLKEGIGADYIITEELAETDYNRLVTCKAYKEKGGECYGFTTFTSVPLYVERNEFRINGDYSEDRVHTVTFIKDMKEKVNFLDYVDIDELEISKKVAEDKYVRCYSDVVKKNLTYKWSIKNGKINGSRKNKTVSVTANKDTTMQCEVSLHGQYLFTAQFNAEMIPAVGFKGYKYDSVIYVNSNTAMNLKLVAWKKGALPKNAVYRYTKNDMVSDVSYTGKKTKSPYAKASLKKASLVKGEGEYICEVFKNSKAKKPMYTISLLAVENESCPEIKLGETASISGSTESLIGLYRKFCPSSSGIYVVKTTGDKPEVFVFEENGARVDCRIAHDNANEYVFSGVKGHKYIIDQYGYSTDGVITMTIDKCSHKYMEMIDGKYIVCTKCGKIMN